MKTYTLPALPYLPRFSEGSKEQTAAYHAAKDARFAVLAALCLDASPLLDHPESNRGLISFELTVKNGSFTSTYHLSVKTIDGGVLQASLGHYGRTDTFKRFAVKDGVIAPRTLENLRELAERGIALAKEDVENQKRNAEQRAEWGNALAVNVAAATQAGLELTQAYDSAPYKAELGALSVIVTADGLTLSASLSMGKLAAVMAFAKTLE